MSLAIKTTILIHQVEELKIAHPLVRVMKIISTACSRVTVVQSST